MPIPSFLCAPVFSRSVWCWWWWCFGGGSLCFRGVLVVVMWCAVKWCGMISCGWFRGDVRMGNGGWLRDVMICDVMSNHVMWFDVVSYHVVSCHVMWSSGGTKSYQHQNATELNASFESQNTKSNRKNKQESFLKSLEARFLKCFVCVLEVFCFFLTSFAVVSGCLQLPTLSLFVRNSWLSKVDFSKGRPITHTHQNNITCTHTSLTHIVHHLYTHLRTKMTSLAHTHLISHEDMI